jgi:hypothetical protein
LTDLAAHVSARDDTIESIGRRAYKDTTCGAWVQRIGRGRTQVGSTRETWTARINRSIVGGVVVSVRKRGATALGLAQRDEWPEHVGEYLWADGRGIIRLDPADVAANAVLVRGMLDGLTADNDADIVRVTRRALVVIVTFVVDRPTWRPHDGGVLVGTIVEGSDVEPLVQPEELLYPFTGKRWDETIQRLEFEADHHWLRLNEEVGR